VFPAAHHGNAIHVHVLHADGQLVRLLERRLVDDGRGVEHGDVGPLALAQQAAASFKPQPMDESANLAGGPSSTDG